MAKQVSTIRQSFVIPAGPAGYYTTPAINISGYNAFSVQAKPTGTSCAAAIQVASCEDADGNPIGWGAVAAGLINNGIWNPIPNPLPSPPALSPFMPAKYLSLAFQNTNPGAVVEYIITLRE